MGVDLEMETSNEIENHIIIVYISNLDYCTELYNETSYLKLDA